MCLCVCVCVSVDWSILIVFFVWLIAKESERLNILLVRQRGITLRNSIITTLLHKIIISFDSELIVIRRSALYNKQQVIVVLCCVWCGGVVVWWLARFRREFSLAV